MKKYGLLLLAILFVPLSANAKTETTWDFNNPDTLSAWDGKGISAFNMTEDGLILQATEQAHMTRPISLGHDIQEVYLRYRSERHTEARLLWHQKGAAANAYVELPFMMERAVEPKEIWFDVTNYSQWDPQTDRIGILLPPGSKVELQKMVFAEYSLFDKIWIGLKSLAKPDAYRAWSINFLWGPRLGTTEAERMNLFMQKPPRGLSVNVILYVICGLLLGWFLLKMHRKILTRQLATVGFLLCFGVLWIGYDLRMGAELIGYAVDDAQSYWFAEPSERTFRERDDFNAFVEEIAPKLKKHDYYTFMTPNMQTLSSIIRYSTFPSLPVSIQNANANVTAGVFLREPDLDQNIAKQIVRRGLPISPPGEITVKRAPHTFLFEITR